MFDNSMYILYHLYYIYQLERQLKDEHKQQLVVNTAQLWRKIRHALEETEPSPWLRLSLSRGQLRILIILSSAGQMCPGRVAAALGVPKANVTEIIERLVEQGLVKREQNLQDRRSHMLTLTEKGKAEVEQLREWSTRRIEKVLERIPGDKLELLAVSLEDMLDAAHSLPGGQESAETDTNHPAGCPKPLPDANNPA
jgi:DNA-binding MarR family transcriptional regulator